MTMVKSPVSTEESPVRPGISERRYIYSGEPPRLDGEQPLRRNRPVRRRKRSLFNIMFTLFVVSVFIVFYIWNKIIVNRLAVEVNDLQMQHEKILSANEVLRAEINKKSGLERIEKIAVSQLGLTYPKEQPVWFGFDTGRLDDMERP